MSTNVSLHLPKNIALVGIAICSWLSLAQAQTNTLTEYRSRILDAIKIVHQLEQTTDETSTALAVTRLRADLPAKETVLLDGQRIAIDNAWLTESLDELRRNKNKSVRAELLARMSERLVALTDRLDEIEKATNVRDKDRDKGHLAEILRRPEFNRAPAEESALQRLWARFMRWLIRLFPRTKPLAPGSSRVLSDVAQVIVVVAGLALIVFLIWKFLPNYLRNRRSKKKTREPRIVLGETLAPDQTSADLLQQAELLARSGDLRGAIRKAYIAFLCELADRKVISLAQHKTNRDYLNSVRERRLLHATMRKLTNSFELHWYGSVPVKDADWTEFRDGYLRAFKTGST